MVVVAKGEKVRIYVAGPITGGGAGSVLKSINRAILAGDELLERGFAPFIPHLNTLWETVCPHHPVQDWLDYDKQWIRVCHGLLRLPGESPGADGEVDFCLERGIPVFYTIRDLEEYFFNG